MCHITGLTKCSKPSRPKKPIFFCAYTEDKLLCLVSCIKEYLHIRAGLVDGKCTHFFHNTWQTTPPNIQGYLTHWVKEVMVCPGIDVTTI